MLKYHSKVIEASFRDKHFGWLDYSVCLKFENGKVYRKKAMLTITLAMLIGILDEVHQSFIPGRGATVRDVFIDVIGALMGVTIALLIIRIRMGRKM